LQDHAQEVCSLAGPLRSTAVFGGGTLWVTEHLGISVNVLWTIRFVLIAAYGVMVVVGSYVLRNRSRYKTLLNSRLLNGLLVIPYLSAHLLVILPSGEFRVPLLCRIEYQPLQARFLLVGGLLVLAGITMQIGTVLRRKAFGVQDVKAGLSTSGLYRYFRHPIYVGIVWVCLGLAILLRSPDGLLVWPAIVALNLLQAVSEESNDMMVRFGEEYRSYRRNVRMFGPIWMWAICLAAVLILVGCSTTPKLTAEERRRDIEFLAQWARDNSPLVGPAQKHKGDPSFEALLPKYLEYAEQAESNEEFCRVVKGYYDVICSAGHRYLLPETELRLARTAIILGIIDVDINPCDAGWALYWARLYWSKIARSCAHPPFGIVLKGDKYFTNSDWRTRGITVPRSSEIVRVNGRGCSSYLDSVGGNPFRHYWDLSDEMLREHLLIINPGSDFSGWQVDFVLPDGSSQHAFVPAQEAYSGPVYPVVEPRDNCTCVELTDEIAYIRIKNMTASMWGEIFPSIHEKDGKTIRAFLEKANGKYRKLVIDIRNNWGGSPYYVYENLVRPFLDEPVTYDQVAGIRRKYRDDLKPSVLKTVRRWCSREQEHVVSTEEIDAPEGFDGEEWVFYRLTRRIEPGDQYDFDGSLYVLTNETTFSAADDYVNAVKRTGLGKLVGRPTRGGCAAYIGPPAIRLPASGMIFRVETEIVINPDGSINELFGTPPDVELPSADPPKSITREELLEDECVKAVVGES